MRFFMSHLSFLQVQGRSRCRGQLTASSEFLQWTESSLPITWGLRYDSLELRIAAPLLHVIMCVCRDLTQRELGVWRYTDLYRKTPGCVFRFVSPSVSTLSLVSIFIVQWPLQNLISEFMTPLLTPEGIFRLCFSSEWHSKWRFWKRFKRLVLFFCFVFNLKLKLQAAFKHLRSLST